MIVNANSIVQYVIQIKNGIMKHVNVNVKIMVKKIKVGILAHAYVRIVSTWNLKKAMELYLLWILYQQKQQILQVLPQ